MSTRTVSVSSDGTPSFPQTDDQGSMRRRYTWQTGGPGFLLVGYFLVLVVIAAATLPTLIGTLHTLDRQQSTFRTASNGASMLLTGGLNQETGMRGFVLTAQSTFLQPYYLGESQIREAERDLRSVSLDDTYDNEVSSTVSAFTAWQRLAARAVSDVEAGDLASGRAVSVQADAKSLFNQFRQAQARLNNAVDTDLRIGRQSLHTQVVRSILILSVAIGLGIVIGVLIWLWWRVFGRRSAQREQELAERAVLLQMAIDASSDSLYAKDLDGRHIVANRARSAALSGGDPEANLIGHTVDEFLDPGVTQDIRRNEELVIRTGHERQFQEVLPFPDGPHIFSMTKSPLRSADGEIHGVVGIARDVTGEMALLADRERLYNLEHHLAETLQLSMLGSADIDDSRLEVCARYIPAADFAVGGDWYDTVAVPDGRVALVIGDAVGHGIESVTAMGQLRSALAALVNLAYEPAAILEVLDQFSTTLAHARSSTCLLAFIDPERERVTYSCAGQMPPIVIPPGQPPQVLTDHQDPPLAVRRLSPRQNTVVPFPVGSILLLYTDGLVERRNELIDRGLRRLVERVEGIVHPSMDDLCDRVIKRLVVPHTQDDDVAMIAARLASKAGPPRPASNRTSSGR